MIDTADQLQRIAHRLAQCRNVAILTHQRPDCDALGSQAALALILKARNIAATVLHYEPVPRQYQFLVDQIAPIPAVVLTPDVQQQIIATADALVCVDTCTFNQMEPARELLRALEPKVIGIDHHRTRDPIGPLLYTDVRAAACVEIIASLGKLLGVPLDPTLARPLLCGLVTDTGWFRFDSVTPNTLRLAADLCEYGVKPSDWFVQITQNDPPSKIGVMRCALESFRWFGNNRIGVMLLTPDDFKRSGAATTQTEGLIDIPMSVQTTEVSGLFTQTDDGRVRVSLRAKRSVDVSAICQQFGGGGHIKAAGCRIEGSLQNAIDQVIPAIEAALPPLPIS
jgi:phosphoesterase RecJ-like protein